MNTIVWKLKKWNVIRYIPLAFLPAFLFFLWLFFLKLTGVTVSLLPVVSDELSWYRQIASVIQSGGPLGYYGYNGAHALMGTFGPWGLVILLPYAAWGAVFGWGLTSMCIANLTFLGTSLFLFALLAHLSRKETRYVCAGYCCLLLVLYYSAFSMAEALRWSMTILICGCLVRIKRGYGGKFFRFVFVPLLIAFCAESYLLLCLFIPLYLMLVLPAKKLPVRMFLSAVITAVAALFLKWMLHFVEAPFVSDISADASLKDRLLYTLEGALKILKLLTPAELYRRKASTFGFPSLLLATALILLAYSLVQALRTWHKEAFWGYAVSAFFLIGVIMGHAFLYNTASFQTLCRGIYTGVVVTVILLSLYQKRTFLLLIFLCALVTLPSFVMISRSNISRRTLTPRQTALMERTKTEFDTIFDISKDNSPWDNTIALYGRRKAGNQTAISLALPTNAGYNGMLDTSLVCEARYAVVYNSFQNEDKYPSILEHLQENGYEISYQNTSLTILTRAE